MRQADKDALVKNHTMLIEKIHTKELFDALVEKTVLTKRQVGGFVLNGNVAREDQIVALLSHLPTCNDAAFDHLCDSLTEIGQSEIADQLRGAVEDAGLQLPSIPTANKEDDKLEERLAKLKGEGSADQGASNTQLAKQATKVALKAD